MRRNLRSTSAYKLMLITSAVLILVFCAGVVSYAQVTVSGTITRDGTPCANARVVITDGTTNYTALTGSTGAYSFTALSGIYKFMVNALNAVPYIDDGFFLMFSTTINVDLQSGLTPTYDDFSGSAIDIYDAVNNPTGKWSYHTSETGTPTTDLSPLSASIVAGNLKISPYPIRSGIRSTSSFPEVTTFEYILPQRYDCPLNDLDACQGFAIVYNNVDFNPDEYIPLIDFRDYGGSTTCPRIYVYLNYNSTQTWRSSTLTAYPYSTRPKISVLKTGKFYDIFVNDTYLSGSSIQATTSPESTYLYLYGKEKATAATGTGAYFDNVRAGIAEPTTSTTIADIKASAANGDTVTVSGGIVTASFTDSFWVENADRSSGIKVTSSTKPAVGQKLIITGQFVRANNEVSITAQSIVPVVAATVPAPIGITGKVAGELDKAGAAVQGLYVKVAGNVTNVVTDSTDTFVAGYYLDDGSGLAGDGSNKGLYVRLDESWKYPKSEVTVGQFRTATGPLTVNTSGTTVIPEVRTLTAIENKLDTFTAYNDFVIVTNDPNINITNYNGNGVTSGYLKDYITGAYVPERVSVFYGNILTTDNYASGANPAYGDVDTYFYDFTAGRRIVSLKGIVTADGTTSGWYVDLNFSNLDPNAQYEFICTAHKNDISNPRETRYTLIGTASFENKSTAGTTTGTSAFGNYTEFNTGMNTNGYVARWRNIKPAADGTFKIKASQADGWSTAYPFGAFRLRRQSGTETD